MIELRGVLTKYPSYMQAMFGGAATIDVKAAFDSAMADSSIRGVCLVIDSPGGAVSGIAELGDAIFAARKSGKIVAVQVDGMMASAAFWLGSQADKIYATHKSDRVGAIGTVMALQDSSKQAEMSGIQVVVATTGALKPMGIPGVAISDTMKASMLATVTANQNEFSAAIQRGRGLSAALVKGVSDGSLMSAADAVAMGLIDGVQSLDVTLAALQGGKVARTANGAGMQPGVTAAQQFQAGVNALAATGLDREKATSRFVRTNPEVHAAFLAEARSGPAPIASPSVTPLKEKPHTKFFMDSVHSFVSRGMSHSAACARVVRENPRAHDAMRAEARNHVGV
ncbi:MAG: S49 family peptidase [Planctomycetota bacterium]